MRRIIIAVSIVLLGALAMAAQAPGLWTGSAVNYPVSAAITQSTCSAPAVGVTNYCTTGVGMFISCNGAAYIAGVSCTPVVAGGVTSWNGQTGAVVYNPPPAPVQSVNGKVGAVILSLQ